MICAPHRAALSARLDGELDCDAPESEALDRHLARCAACRRWAADAERLRTMSDTTPGPATDWTDRLLKSLTAHRDGPAGN
ncbi:zf-HC2 domain-containing protein [Streptomyces sp. S186]|uniref:zf-HC2 domain-containing protein n=1 Tax=Streptomyces sp. S186 TaxID=3434395 RepID=UPI003F6654E1